ncbi:TIR domain-containing protein, partial [Dactylosporangium sp. NPDC005572]|uniref:tetratricopeptide repeat protein n=1 Tax=Dactylosporangium sp. NPDC005572 TaxID=3156889 RepID=UPI0033AE325D
MSTSEGRIVLNAAQPGVEFTVCNADLAVVATGCGHLDVGVPPGLYRIERRAGDTASTEVVLVAPGSTVRRENATVPLHTVAPVTISVEDRPVYLAEAEAASAHAASQAVAGLASLVVVICQDRPFGQRAHFAELGLIDADGHPVPSWRHGWRTAGTNIASWSANLPPGGHLIRMPEDIEIPLYLMAGWQTILFCLHGDLRDTHEMSVHLMPADQPWRADDPGAAAVETALAALRRRSGTYPADAVSAWLTDGADTNPILGVLAAHLLRRTTDPNMTLYAAVVDRLLRLLPDHPDVAALATARTGTIVPGGRRVTWPPMLATAYHDLLLPADLVADGAIVEGSLAERIAPHLVRTGLWLAWRTPPPPTAADPATTARTAAFLAQVAAVERSTVEKVAARWTAQDVARSTALPLRTVRAAMLLLGWPTEAATGAPGRSTDLDLRQAFSDNQHSTVPEDIDVVPRHGNHGEKVGHDVFLSFSRQGHPEVAQRAYDVLKAAGISVYMDADLPGGARISDELIAALGASRIVVVVYSAAYNRRSARQWELVHASLAGAAEGDASGRLLIINPEADERHIVPYVVADVKFLRPGQLAELPGQVRRKLAAHPQPMQTVRRLDPPRWLPRRVPGQPGYSGRFADLWRVHNALSGVDKPLTFDTWTGPAAVLTGIAGIGKTSLAKGYAWLFGDAYPGGIFWVGVEGAGGLPAARARHADQVRQLARSVGLPVGGEDPDRLAMLLAEHLDDAGEAFLWVVDGLPDDLDAEQLAHFTLPARRARMLFTARRHTAGPVVALDGVWPEDGLAVLDAARPVTPADRAAALSIVERLGGHPLALSVVAARMRGGEGLRSYADYARTLTSADAGANILGVIAESLRPLGERDRTVIVLAGLLDPAPVPAALVRDVLTAVDPTTTVEDVVDSLDRLRRGGFAAQDGDAWTIHPLVVEAAGQLGRPATLAAAVAPAAAAALLPLLDAAGDPLLIGHARALANVPSLTGTGPAAGLRRRIAAYHHRTGESYFRPIASDDHRPFGRATYTVASRLEPAGAAYRPPVANFGAQAPPAGPDRGDDGGDGPGRRDHGGRVAHSWGPMPGFSVVALGGPGSGKTTFLAQMYDRLRR